jgi:cation:H+ antiporter
MGLLPDTGVGVYAVFGSSALVIAVAGLRLTICVEQIARVTGLGNLLAGTILIGLVTSPSGLLASVSAAWEGHASLAVSNSLGGIAAQTMFLAIADIAYRDANLECRAI